MNTQEKVAKLEALLGRIREKVRGPRFADVQTGPALPLSSPEEAPTMAAARAAPGVPESRVELSSAKDEPMRDEAPSVEVAVAEMAEVHVEEEYIEEIDAVEEDADRTSGEMETAPASSRRPMAEEKPLAELAFGDAPEQPQIHTPPPKSGRLPAAVPTPEYELGSTGVRAAADAQFSPEPASFVPGELDLSGQTRPEAYGQRMPAVAPKVSPQMDVSRTVGEVAQREDVAEFVGAVPHGVVTTVGDALEATLSL